MANSHSKTEPTRSLPASPCIMGIVNINDDSFSGDGSLELTDAINLSRQMLAEGAMIIDVGAESARTNRDAIKIEEEINRLLPFIEQWPELIAETTSANKPWLSINTWRPEIIAAVLETGKVDLINDISGLPDPTNAELCAKHDVMLLIMHTVGIPKIAHTDQQYTDVWQALESFFEEKIAIAKAAGLSDSQILLDPGIDFAKQQNHNLAIFQQLERLNQWGYPVLLPISRKTVIGDVLDLPAPTDRDPGTIACLARGLLTNGPPIIDVFRVHNVKAAADTMRVLTQL